MVLPGKAVMSGDFLAANSINNYKTKIRMCLAHVPQSNKRTKSKAITRLSKWFIKKIKITLLC